MADSFKTLAQLVTLNDQRNAPVDISDILNSSPVLARLPAVTANETTYKYLRYSTAPTVGFRAAYDGRDNSKSSDTQVSVDLQILDATFAVDKAIADAYKDGAESFISKEARRSLEQAMFFAERQFFYGTVSPGNSSGFVGLGDETDLNGASDALVVNAGGTTAGTGSSAWLIRLDGDNATGVIVGKGGNLEIGATTIARIAGSSTGTFPGYYTPISGWLGMQRGSTYDVARIANLTADSGKGLTDALISSAIALFPAARAPSIIAMNRRSYMQLQKSRTATNPTGAPAPFPTDSFGIPIIVTDAIVSTETLLA